MSKIIPYIILLFFLNSCSPIIKTHGYTIENTSDFLKRFLTAYSSGSPVGDRYKFEKRDGFFTECDSSTIEGFSDYLMWAEI